MARTARVTGGTRGPGRAIAPMLRGGWRIAATCRADDAGFSTGATFDVNGGQLPA